MPDNDKIVGSVYASNQLISIFTRLLKDRRPNFEIHRTAVEEVIRVLVATGESLEKLYDENQQLKLAIKQLLEGVHDEEIKKLLEN